jgi:hypothetical protein
LGGRVYGKYREKQPTADSLQSTDEEEERGTGTRRSVSAEGGLGEGVGRSEMAQMPRPLSIAGEA